MAGSLGHRTCVASQPHSAACRHVSSAPAACRTIIKDSTASYDDTGHLLSEQHSSGTIDTWTYDPAGNRLTRSRTVGGVTTVATSTYDQAAQLTTLLAGTALTTFAYDLNGNLHTENTSPAGITTYTWDALNRLLGVIPPSGSPSTYTYRYDDLRSTQNLGTGVQSLVWDVPGFTGFGDLFEELDSSGGLIRAYFRATDLATQRDNSGSYAFHWMDAGTAQILTDSTGAAAQNYQFSAWGEQFAAPGAASTPMAWNGLWGYYQDPGTTARNWVRARHLDVLRGRWFSQDPPWFTGNPNLYVYTDNRPLALTDPEGLAPPPVAIRPGVYAVRGIDPRTISIIYKPTPRGVQSAANKLGPGSVAINGTYFAGSNTLGIVESGGKVREGRDDPRYQSGGRTVDINARSVFGVRNGRAFIVPGPQFNPTGCEEALGGLEPLVVNSRPVSNFYEPGGFDPRGLSGSAGRPRTAVGIDAKGKVIFLAADEKGRMTLAQLARTMIQLGAVTAVALDGGRSTSLAVGGTAASKRRPLIRGVNDPVITTFVGAR